MKQTNITTHYCLHSRNNTFLQYSTLAAAILTNSTTSNSTPAARSGSMDGEGGGGETEIESDEEEMEVEPDEAAPHVKVGSSRGSGVALH